MLRNCIAKGAEKGIVKIVVLGSEFSMPLNANGESGRMFDAYRLNRAVIRYCLHLLRVRQTVNSLGVQGIDHDLMSAIGEIL